MGVLTQLIPKPARNGGTAVPLFLAGGTAPLIPYGGTIPLFSDGDVVSLLPNGGTVQHRTAICS